MSAMNRAAAALVIAGPSLAAFVPITVVPALPSMAREFGAAGDGALLAQLVMSAPSAMILFGAPMGAFVSERVGRRNCLLAALLVFSLSGVAGLWISDPYLLIATRVLLGLATGVTMGLSITFAGDYFEGEQRERVLGYAAAGSSLFSVFLLGLGGWWVQWWGWHAPFCFYLAGLVPFLIAWLAMDRIVPSELRERVAAPERTVKSVLRLLWPAYLLVIFLSTGLFMLTVQGTFLLEANGISSPGARGMILSLYSLTAFAASMTYGYLRRRLGAREILVLTALSMGVGLAAAGAVHSVAGFILVIVTVGIGAGLTDPVINSVVLARAPQSARARASGFAISAFFVGQFLTPLLTDPIRRLWGIAAAFWVHGALLILIAVMVLNTVYFAIGGVTVLAAQAGADE
jgi:MFS family permease